MTNEQLEKAKTLSKQDRISRRSIKEMGKTRKHLE